MSLSVEDLATSCRSSRGPGGNSMVELLITQLWGQNSWAQVLSLSLTSCGDLSKFIYKMGNQWDPPIEPFCGTNKLVHVKAQYTTDA